MKYKYMYKFFAGCLSRINWYEMETYQMQVEKYWSDRTRTTYYVYLSDADVNEHQTQFALPKNLYKSRVHHCETHDRQIHMHAFLRKI